MLVISCTPICAHSSNENKKLVPIAAPKYKTKQRHWRQCASDPCLRRSITIEQRLQNDLNKYKTANKRLKSLAQWNLRSTKSTLKDIEEMLEVIEDIYGDSAYEEIKDDN